MGPDPARAVKLAGQPAGGGSYPVHVHMGPYVDTPHEESTLLYDEFIVYNVNQVRARAAACVGGCDIRGVLVLGAAFAHILPRAAVPPRPPWQVKIRYLLHVKFNFE